MTDQERIEKIKAKIEGFRDKLNQMGIDFDVNSHNWDGCDFESYEVDTHCTELQIGQLEWVLKEIFEVKA